MKKLFILILALSSTFAFSYHIDDYDGDTLKTCSGTIYDSGGSYSNNEDYSMTICSSTAGDQIQILFLSYATELDHDYLDIYDGTSTSDPYLGRIWGDSGDKVTAVSKNNDGCLFLVWHSDESGTDSGFEGDISCVPSSSGAPTQADCLGAIPICNDFYDTADSYEEEGNLPDEINGLTSCLGVGEKNDVWYVFTGQQTADISFILDPKGNDDYDWAMYDLTNAECKDIFYDQSLELSCNYAAGSGDNTGSNSAASDASGNHQDSEGTQWNDDIPIVKGGIYVINVSNYSSSADGFTIDFSASSAAVVDTVPPELKQITSSPACGESEITFDFSERVLCSSATESDFTVTGPDGATYSVTSIVCNSGATYSQSFTITLDVALTAGGTYSLNLVGQVDDACLNTVNGNTLSFDVSGVEGSASTTQNVTCNSGEDGTAVASATGGTSPYSYNWDSNANNQTTATASNLGAGTYSVTITDAGGVCQVTKSVTVTEPGPISITFTTTDVQCNGGSDGTATASPTGGNGATWTYNWSEGGATSSATNTGLSAGTTYIVTVSDNKSCPKTSTITVSEPTALAISGISQQEPLCNGDNNGQLSVQNPSGGTPNYTYNWNAGGATSAQTNTGLAAGTYSVTVEDAHNCQLIQSGITLGQPDAITNTNTITDATCNGNSNGSIATSASGGTGTLTYTWSANTGGQTSATASNLSAGSYDVTIEDTHNCNLTNTSITVAEDPVIVITVTSNNDATCGNADGNATVSASGGSGSGYTYTWGTSPTQQTGATVSSVAAGGYDVTVSDSHSCTQVATININNASAPTITEVTTSHVDVLCNGNSTGSGTVSGSGGTGTLVYSWSNGAGDVTTSDNLTAGVYNVTVSDDNNCKSSLTITITEPAVLNVIISDSQDPTCNGGNNGQATASSSGGPVNTSYTYSWSAGGATSSATNTGLGAGTYNVTVKDGNGCKDVATVTLSEPSAVSIDATTSTNPLCFGDANGTATVTTTSGGTSGTGNYTYSWDSNAGNQTGQTATGLAKGTYNVTVKDDNGCTATTSITLTQPTLLQASTTVTDAQCNGSSDGTATVTGTGGSIATDYDYTWDAGGATSSATNIGLGAGTYNVTVKDDNGCAVTSSATISEPATALSILSKTWQNISCNGADDGYGIITGTGGTSPLHYSWGGGQITDSIGSLSPGTYNLTITDAHSCTISSSVTITQPDALSATVSSSDATCNSYTDGNVNLTPAGGTTQYHYSWSNSETTQNITAGAGTYSVTITDAHSCTFVTSGKINEPDTITVTYSSTESDCNGATGTATVTPTGGDNNFTYKWSTIPSQQSQTANNLASGAYTVTINDGNNCEFIQTVNVNDFGAATIAIDTSGNINCYGDSTGYAHVSVVSGTGPYSYTWENSEGDTLSTTDTLYNLPAGNYSVTVLDNGCSSNTTVNVTQNPELELDFSRTNITCNGYSDGEVIVTPSGGFGTYNYSWSHDGTLTDSTGSSLEAGSYVVTVSDALGCNDSIAFNVYQPDTIQIDFVNTTDVLCYGDSTGKSFVSVAGGSQPYSYSWSSGETSTSANHLYYGYNTVLVTDDHGCTSLDSVLINQPDSISITAVITNSVCAGNSGNINITTSGGTPDFTYAWNHDATLTTNAANGLSQGNYQVTVTDALGCQLDTSFNVIDDGAGTASITSVNDVLCYNESTGSATIEMTGGTADFTYVVSISGVQIDSTSSSNSSYDVSNLFVGNYDVIVYDANGCSSNTNITIDQPEELIITDSVVNIDCYNNNNGSILINATGGTPTYTYNWNLASTESALTNLSAGYYSVTVTDINACNKKIDSIQITQPTELVLSVDNVKDLTCNNDSTGAISILTTGGTANYTYLWSNGDTTANITGINAGTYTVSITDNNLCNDTLNVTVNQPNQIVLSDNIYYDNNYYGGIEVTVSGGTPNYTYLWSNGETDSCSYNLSAGDYWITVTDANGCISSNYYKIEIPLIIPTVITPNADGKNDNFRIVNVESVKTINVNIFNRWGDLIFNYSGTGMGYVSNEWNGTSLSGKELPLSSFVYIVDVNNGEEKYNGTVTIVK